MEPFSDNIVRASTTLSKIFERTEVEKTAAALEEHRWNISKVYNVLGIPGSTLYRRTKQYGLE